MRNDTKSVKLVAKLLRETSSLAIVGDFLKGRGLHHSVPSWDEVLNKRLLPAIKSKHIVIQDLIELLRNVEEYGRQHVFLYRCSEQDAAILMEQVRVNSIMSECGLVDLIDKPKVLDQPQTPEISDIRWEPKTSEKPNQFIIKIIETRETSELISEDSKGDILTKKWRIKKDRAVNLFKLHADGLLELRITSQSNSRKYKQKVDQAWELVAEFLPNAYFGEISLLKIKDRLWRDRTLLQDTIKFSHVTLKNDAGNTIIAGVGSSASNLHEDKGIIDSVQAFVENDAYCDSHNICFKITGGCDQDKPREIHVLLSGEVNEFAIPAHCSSQEYEYVINQIRFLNN